MMNHIASHRPGQAQHREPELQDGEFRKLLDTLREPQGLFLIWHPSPD
jgi:hypothetical protein